jgi:hypothetical protein
MPSKKRMPAIICGGETGRAVVYGYVDKLPEVGEAVTVYDARMVLYWPSECGGLFGLATKGAQTGLRLTSKVAKVRDTCRQALTVSAKAAKALDGWPDA